MKRKKGFALLELGMVLGALAIAAALAFAVHSWWESHNDAMKEAGRKEVREQVAERDEAQRLKVEAERVRLAKEKSDKEAADAAQLKEKEDAYQRKLAAAKGELDTFMSDVNAGRIVWRQPASTASGSAGGSTAVLPAPATDVGVCAGLLGRGTIPAEALSVVRSWCNEAVRADAIRAKLVLARGELAICTGEAALPKPVR